MMSEGFPIGLTGFAKSGKSEVAKHLCEKYGYSNRHIGRPLKDMNRVLLKALGLQDRDIDALIDGYLKETFVPGLPVTSRQLQVSLGTEWGREMIDPDLWVKCWKVGVSPWSRVVNDSIRFKNEAAAIRDLNGIIIRVVRPGVGPRVFRGKLARRMYSLTGAEVFCHPSERPSHIRASFTIMNDGSIEELRASVDHIMGVTNDD